MTAARDSTSFNPALRDFISVFDYGVMGDGTTDDTSNLLSATEAARNNGKKLRVPAGTFLVSGSITNDSNPNPLSIEGDDPRLCLFKQASGLTASVISLTAAGSFTGSYLLSAASNPGDDSVTLTSVSGLSIGNIVLLRDSTQPIYGNVGSGLRGVCSRAGEYAEIKTIVGNTITFYGRLDYGYTTSADVRLLNGVNHDISGIGFVNSAPTTQAISARAINVKFFNGLSINHVYFRDLDADAIQISDGCDFTFSDLDFRNLHDLEVTNDPYCIIASFAVQHGLVEHCRSRYGRHVFTTNSLVTTKIAGASVGQTLPQSTINVMSTAGFSSSGTIYVGTSVVTYTGTSGGNQFTGCSGGTTMMTSTTQVSQGPEVAPSYIKVADSIATNHSQAGFDCHPGARKIVFENLTVHNSYPGAPGIQVRGPDCDVINPTISQTDPGVYFVYGADRGRLRGGRIDGCQTAVQVQDSDDCFIGGDVFLSSAAVNAVLLSSIDPGWTMNQVGIGDVVVEGSPTTIFNDGTSGAVAIFYSGRIRTPGATSVLAGGNVDAYWNPQRTSNVSTFPSLITASITLTSGTIYGIPATVRETGTYGHLRFSTAGTVSGLTDLRLGIYSPPGTNAPLVQGSANLASSVTATNTVYSLALGSSVQLYAGQTVLLAIGFIGTGLAVLGASETMQTASLRGAGGAPRSASGWTTGTALLSTLSSSVPSHQPWLELLS